MSLDIRDRGTVTVDDLTKIGASEVVVSHEQALDLYTEMQQRVRFIGPDFEGFHSTDKEWRAITIIPADG